MSESARCKKHTQIAQQPQQQQRQPTKTLSFEPHEEASHAPQKFD